MPDAGENKPALAKPAQGEQPADESWRESLHPGSPQVFKGGGGGGRQPSEQEEILPRRQMRELKKEVTMLREEI